MNEVLKMRYAKSRRIVWMCLTISWGWRLRRQEFGLRRQVFGKSFCICKFIYWWNVLYHKKKVTLAFLTKFLKKSIRKTHTKLSKEFYFLSCFTLFVGVKNSKFYTFFNCYFAAPRPTSGQYLGSSFTPLMLITAFLHIRPESHREARSEVGSLSPIGYLVGFEPGTFRFY